MTYSQGPHKNHPLMIFFFITEIINNNHKSNYITNLSNIFLRDSLCGLESFRHLERFKITTFLYVSCFNYYSSYLLYNSYSTIVQLVWNKIFLLITSFVRRNFCIRPIFIISLLRYLFL